MVKIRNVNSSETAPPAPDLLLRQEVQGIIGCLSARTTRWPDNLSTIDPERFLYVVNCHRLASILYQHLKTLPGVPTRVLSQLRESSVRNTFRQFSFVSELCQVVKLLGEHQIEAISLKGPLLSQRNYGDYTTRECKDIDILVPSTDLEAAYSVLTTNGYVLSEVLWNTPKQEAVYRETFHHYSLYHPERAIELELHWRLNAENTEEQALWANAAVQWVGGIAVKTLSPADTFMYLCVHGGMHQWKRLFWLLDIAHIIEKDGSELLQSVYQTAVDTGRTRYVLSACLLANTLLGVRLPKPINEAIQTDKSLPRLVDCYLFWINAVSEPYSSPVESFSAFRLSAGRFLNAYKSVFYLENHRGIRRAMRHFFIRPNYWATYAFTDRFFAMNYVAAPFLWIHSMLNKGK